MKKLTVNIVGKYLFLSFMAGALSACGGSDTKIVERDPIPNPAPIDPQPTQSESGARLLITKPGIHDEVLVYDLAEKTEIANLSVNGTITGLYASPSYRYGIAVQGTTGVVNFLDSGVEWEGHGDHGHLHLNDPKVLDLRLSGTKPGHVTQHEDQTVIFFDGAEGTPAQIRVVTETGIAESVTLAEYTDNIHQHGAAQAWDDYLVSTVRDGNVIPATTLPSMVKISARLGDQFHDHKLLSDTEYACPNLHGSAKNSGYIIFGCSDGVLAIESDSSQFHAHKISHGTRISSLFGHPNVINFVGAGRNANSDPVSLFTINPITETITSIAYDKTPRAYGFAEEGELFLILDTEGGLTAFDTVTWAATGARLQITSAAEAEGQISRLTISANGENAYVTDSGAKKILKVDLHEWAVDNEATIELDFIPGPILWLGNAAEESHQH